MKKKFNSAKFLIIISFLSVTFLPTTARTEFFSEEYGMPKQLDVVIGESKIINVSKPKRIALGDPAIADVAGASNTEILVSAKQAGETNLQIWDDYGQREVTIRVFAEDLNKLKKRLQDLFATAGINGVKFQVGDQERKIFVLGDLPLRKKDVVVQLLENFKEKIIDLVTYTEDNPLVEVDVQVLEISKTAIDQLGINWSSTVTFSEAIPPSHTFNRQFGDMVKSIWQSRYDRTALTAVLSAMQQDNLARVLARPKLVALSGKEAKFLVGGEVPVLSDVSVSSGTTTTSVEYVEYGIKLNIKPEVKENGDILCQLLVEIKTLDTSTQLTVQTGSSISTSTPGFKTRTVSTELYLKNNQTIFLAGLIDNQETNNLQAVPGLSSVPVLGMLFRSKNFRLGDSELVVSLTPRVLSYGDMSKDINSASSSKQDPDEEPVDAYKRMVQEKILKSVTYPLEAQRANLSGQVVLSLHLLPNGSLVGTQVSDSSGHKLLDNAAMFTVKRLAPYPEFPKGLFLKEIWVDVPITYQIN